MQHKTALVETAVLLNVCSLIMPTAVVLMLQACEKKKMGKDEKKRTTVITFISRLLHSPQQFLLNPSRQKQIDR